MKIICPKHGLLKQCYKIHLYGKHKCPRCSNNVSEIANEWLASLNIPNDSEHREVFISISRI